MCCDKIRAYQRLNDVLVSAGGRHVHSVDVDASEERSGESNDGWSENVPKLSRLADMASANVPSYVAPMARPPESLCECGLCRMNSAVSSFIMSSA